MRTTYLPSRGAGVTQRYPAGHFYSPIPDLRDVSDRKSDLFDRSIAPRDVDLNVEPQWDALSSLGSALSRVEWDDFGIAGGRYKFKQDMFGRGDAVALAGMLLDKRPQRFVEVGSGWSTAVALDMRDHALPDLQVTCIEPFPERLLSILSPDDEKHVRLVKRRVQLVADDIFGEIRPGDLLFIDSSHVGKIGSDLLHLLFHVLPQLPAGTFIHFHDIPWPFEYWEHWIFDGWAWNEAYYLHAFLSSNSRYRVHLWPHMLWTSDERRYRQLLPHAEGNVGGSIWIVKHQHGD